MTKKKKAPLEREIREGLSSVLVGRRALSQRSYSTALWRGQTDQMSVSVLSVYIVHNYLSVTKGYDILCSTSQVFFLQKFPGKRSMYFAF